MNLSCIDDDGGLLAFATAAIADDTSGDGGGVIFFLFFGLAYDGVGRPTALAILALRSFTSFEGYIPVSNDTSCPNPAPILFDLFYYQNNHDNLQDNQVDQDLHAHNYLTYHRNQIYYP